ncbi:hypothetical protein LTR94_018856 [Friedmanniomyces endolithicus]|nr:hypothetical protein LTR94_018856 [Friedmanniomyces endolithicus]
MEHLRNLEKRYGIDVRVYNPIDVSSFQPTEKAKLIWLEAAGSVTLEFPDLVGLVKKAQTHHVLTALDNTWGAGLAFNAFDFSDAHLSVDVTVHALTKYPSGGGDILMGSVVTRERALHHQLFRTHAIQGISVSGDDVAQVQRSLASMRIRYAAQSESALQLLAWLKQQPEFVQVLHPADSSAAGHSYWKDICVDQHSAGLVSVIFKPEFDLQDIRQFCDALSLFKLGFSWGGPVSLVMLYDLKDMRALEHTHLQQGRSMSTPIIIAKKTTNTQQDVVLHSKFANRHGLIAGATGTGKTVTLKVLAESFSRLGVPVFLADAKGDVSSLAQAGASNPKFDERIKSLGIDSIPFAASPVVFWDLFAEQGHPIRTTITEIGPLLLARMLNLNDTQEGVLSAVFRIADDQGMLLIDFKDLKAMIGYVSEHAAEFKAEYGNLSPASLGAIQRNLLALADQGGDQFFGEPSLNILDFIQTDSNGHGYINILAADKLMNTPKLYATFLLWMLSELFEQLPEVGDMDKPKLVFFFDEAHLLFDNASAALQEKIEQVVRLIRSKGVGIYFVTQNPLDLPESVLGQLGNRVQHALRAFTPKDQKAVKTAADTFRANPEFKVEQAITELAVGEALISCLDEQGTPQVVERAWVMPPYSSFSPISPEQRQTLISQSIVAGIYEKSLDRESAFELLQNKVVERQQQAVQIEQEKQQTKEQEALAKQKAKEAETLAKQQAREQERIAKEQQKEAEREAKQREKLIQDTVGTFAKSAARSLGGSTGQKIVRGLLGSLFGRK